MNDRIQAVRINEQILLLNDNDESTCYLVTGTQRALLIDTANGYVDLKVLCEELTDLPVTVVNTHGHGDHVFGNVYFEEVFLHPDDVAVHDRHVTCEEMQVLMAERGLRAEKLLPLKAGDVFDLGGGLSLEVVPLKGHTPGSVGLLDRKHRILFSGDGIIPQIWMQLAESMPIATLRDTLLTIRREHGDEFDWLLTGHGRGLESAAMVDALLRGCGELLRGERAADEAYVWPEGVCLAHPYGPGEYDRIVYDETKL